MSEQKHRLVVKFLSVGLAAVAIRAIVIGMSGDPGFFMGAGALLFGVFLLAVAHGLSRFRGWAWLASIQMLLVAWLVNLVRMIVGLADPESSADGWVHFVILIVVSLLIAYLGRWTMERRFRMYSVPEAHA